MSSILTARQTTSTHISPQEHSGLRAEIRTIYPNEAMELLTRRNGNVRAPKQDWVRSLAAALRRGEGELTWDAIAIGADGSLPNGQHRLEAIVESGVPLPCVIITGLPPTHAHSGDRGSRRTIGEILKARGEKNANRLAATISLLALFEASGEPFYKGGGGLTPTQAIAILNANPDLRSAASGGTRRLPALSPAAGDLLWLLCNRISSEDAMHFFNGVGSGRELSGGDVQLLLRDKLLAAERMRDTSREVPARMLAAYFIQGWNSWRRGEGRAIFRFRPGGASPDRFPLLDGYPYSESVLQRLSYEVS